VRRSEGGRGWPTVAVLDAGWQAMQHYGSRTPERLGAQCCCAGGGFNWWDCAGDPTASSGGMVVRGRRDWAAGVLLCCAQGDTGELREILNEA
jgi:hypothetical protein